MFDRRIFFLILVILLSGNCLSAQTASSSGRLRIAAAADLQPVLPEIIREFEQQAGIRTDASFQSSATLATQIINGAPFDLFLAADTSFPQRVIDGGRAEEPRPIPSANGTLVLWTRNDSGVRSLTAEALSSDAIRSIAIANPEHAPYGGAARATLEHWRILSAVRPKLRIAENIAQAAQYADSGNAQVGFISLTSALTPRLETNGHFVRVPPQDYPPLLQGAVIVRGAAHASAAHRFLDFLHTPSVAHTLVLRGLEPVS